MTVYKTFNNTAPSQEREFWQIVILPTICIYRCDVERYTAINLEWLFWSYTSIIR